MPLAHMSQANRCTLYVSGLNWSLLELAAENMFVGDMEITDNI